MRLFTHPTVTSLSQTCATGGFGVASPVAADSDEGPSTPGPKDRDLVLFGDDYSFVTWSPCASNGR
jgi:hypothetical protein